MNPECRWTYHETWYADYWQTECGNEHQFINDGPIENGYKYCPYCGKTVIEEDRHGTMGLPERDI